MDRSASNATCRITAHDGLNPRRDHEPDEGPLKAQSPRSLEAMDGSRAVARDMPLALVVHVGFLTELITGVAMSHLDSIPLRRSPIRLSRQRMHERLGATGVDETQPAWRACLAGSQRVTDDR